MAEKIKVILCGVDGCDYHADSQAKVDGHRGRVHSARKPQALAAIEHGTPKGARAHRRRGERPCPACRIAWAIYQRRFKAEHSL